MLHVLQFGGDAIVISGVVPVLRLLPLRWEESYVSPPLFKSA